jgi:glucoamylase
MATPQSEVSEPTSDGGHMYRLSRCILLAHEDKTFQGALVASMSILWGETRSDDDLGGYHVVWTRDLAQSATALLAMGQTGTPLHALIWLAAIQSTDGRFPQNSWIDGNAYWSMVVLPYEQYLKRFPSYLQQLTIGSNGKHVTLDGTEVA